MKETSKKKKKKRISTHSMSPAWGDRAGAGGAGVTGGTGVVGGMGVAGGTGVAAGGIGGAVGCGSSVGLNWVPVLVRSWVYWTTGPLLLTAPTGKMKVTIEKMTAVTYTCAHT